MPTWTSSARISALIVAGLTLSACGGGFRVPDVMRASPASPPPMQTVTVSKRQLIVAAPPGFCVDREASQLETDPAFVLFGNCAAISDRSASFQPEVRALLTASVSQNGSGTPIRDTLPALDGFFRSEDGRAALSRDGDPATVEVLDTFQQEDTYFLHATDTSEPVAPGAANEFWRAYFDVEDQIVSVSVIGFVEKPLSPEQSLLTLRKFANRIRENNGLDPFMIPAPSDDTVTVAATEPAPEPTPRPTRVSDTADSPYETDDDYVAYDTGDSRPYRRNNVNPLRVLQTVGLLRQLFM